MIKPPPSPTAFADRDLDCQMALEDEIQALTKRAEAAGWRGGEVAGALLALATAHIKARIGAAEVAHSGKLHQSTRSVASSLISKSLKVR